MNKSEFITAISEKTGQTKTATDLFVGAFQDVVLETLAEGGKIQLVGFGTFEVTTRKERKGRNPKTQEEMIIPEKKAPKFKAGKQLKDVVK